MSAPAPGLVAAVAVVDAHLVWGRSYSEILEVVGPYLGNDFADLVNDREPDVFSINVRIDGRQVINGVEIDLRSHDLAAVEAVARVRPVE